MTDQEQPAPGSMQHLDHEATGCAEWIPGVPKSVARSRILELIDALGLDTKQLRGLRIEANAIYAEVYALKDGHRFWDGSWRPDAQSATHCIVIPFVDQEA